MKKMHTNAYYESNYSLSLYEDTQIARHAHKANKQRNIDFYETVCGILKTIEPSLIGKEMICLGTRNNWERNSFRTLLDTSSVYSLDIAPASQADFIYNFNELPVDWNGKWDIIYSNALDHCVNATQSFLNWVQVLKKGGILILGLKLDISSEVSKADCCSFSSESILSFLQAQKSIKILREDHSGYSHYFLKKI